MKITLIFFSESKPGDKKKLREDKDWTQSLTVLTLPLANIFILYIAAMKKLFKEVS